MASVKESNEQLVREFYRKAGNIIVSSDMNSLYGISNDDSICATGYNENGKLDVFQSYYSSSFNLRRENWKNVIKIASNDFSVVVLKSDGTVLSTGETFCSSSEPSDLDVNNWSNIVDIARGKYVTAGLKNDGTVIATGTNFYGSCNVDHFRSIIQIVVGVGFVAGLRSDGKVDFAGVDSQWLQEHPDDGRYKPHAILHHCYDVSSWRDVVRLYTAEDQWAETIFGLKKDGTVLLSGSGCDSYYDCMKKWTNIIDLYVGDSGEVIGLKEDHSIVTTYNDFKKEIDQVLVSLSTNQAYVVSAEYKCRTWLLLRSDGTVVEFSIDEMIPKVLNWKNLVAVRQLDNDLIIGLQANGNVLQSKDRTLTAINSNKQSNDLANGLYKDDSSYTEDYCIKTSSWHLKKLELDAYVLVIRLMINGDSYFSKGLLQTVDYLPSSKDLMSCLNAIDDKEALFRTIVSGTKQLHDYYGLSNKNLYRVHYSEYRQICKILKMILDYPEARDYLEFLYKERINMRYDYIVEKQRQADDCWVKMQIANAEKNQLQDELDKLPSYLFYKKGNLKKRIDELEKRYKSLDESKANYLHSIRLLCEDSQDEIELASELSDSLKSKDSVTKTMDELFSAAVNGDVHTVKELLAQHKNIDNETYKVTQDDGTELAFSVIFSILAKMNENGIHYEVMDALSDAGVDYNQAVELRNMHNKVVKHSIRPFLFYTIKVWNNIELTRYLLEHGANPDAIVIDNDDNEYDNDSFLTMLSYAIRYCENVDMTQLLLTYGANPQKPCFSFATDMRYVRQRIPHIFYSVVEQSSPQKTACLLHYGATTNEIIEVRIGEQRNTFLGYLNMNHPEKTRIIDIAYSIVRSLPAPTVKYVYKNMISQLPEDKLTSYSVTHPLLSYSLFTQLYDVAPQSNSSSDQDVIGQIKTRIQKFLDSDTGKKIKQKCSDIKTSTQKLYSTATEKLKAMLKK